MRRLDGFGRRLGAAALAIALLIGAGAIWTAGADQKDADVVALAYDRGTDTLLKAYARTLYRSSDGGQSWKSLAISSSEKGQIAAIAASPAGKGVAYVVGMGLGVLRSVDDGKSLIERDAGLPTRDVIAVAAHATQPETVYVVVSGHGVYRSQDAGKSWRLMEPGSQGGIQQLVHSDMAGSMQTGWLFAATSKGVRRTMDCFCLWTDAGKLGTEAHAITYDPGHPDHFYTVTDKGLFRSSDGGESWVQMTSPSSKAVALAFAPSNILYAIDGKGALFRSADDGSTWIPVDA
ncbi:MAG: WD40/YVTN/BNR-like repeat-containing protein [Bradyrhizobium sp.]